MKSKWVLGLILTLLAGCATGYGARGLSGGYSETQLDRNVWTVSFNGNGYTSSERAVDFTLLRSAEVALDHGFKYFVIVGQSSGEELSSVTTWSQNSAQTHVISKPGVSNRIVCFVERPNEVFSYDAEFLANSLRTKYGLRSRSSEREQTAERDREWDEYWKSRGK